MVETCGCLGLFLKSLFRASLDLHYVPFIIAAFWTDSTNVVVTVYGHRGCWRNILCTLLVVIESGCFPLLLIGLLERILSRRSAVFLQNLHGRPFHGYLQKCRVVGTVLNCAGSCFDGTLSNHVVVAVTLAWHLFAVQAHVTCRAFLVTKLAVKLLVLAKVALLLGVLQPHFHFSNLAGRS